MVCGNRIRRRMAFCAQADCCLPQEWDVWNDAECETILTKQREVQHEIPNCNLGGCGVSRCERVGGLFLSGKQGPSDRTDRVHSYPVNLPGCDYRFALPG